MRLPERSIVFTDGSGKNRVTHIFDGYHDYTLCGKSVYAEEIKNVRASMKTEVKAGYCRKCQKLFAVHGEKGSGP